MSRDTTMCDYLRDTLKTIRLIKSVFMEFNGALKYASNLADDILDSAIRNDVLVLLDSFDKIIDSNYQKLNEIEKEVIYRMYKDECLMIRQSENVINK